MQRSGKETDEILAVASAAGDPEAFEALVRRHGPAVRALLERLVGHYHDAWDLTQDVWLKVHRSLGSFDARRPFRPWLLRIALNHGRDALRRAAARPRIGADPGGPDGVGEAGDTRFVRAGSDPSQGVLERAEIAHALERVSEPFREALVLVDVLGLTYDEVAQTLACALGTVKSRVGRGRSEFRRHYERLPGARMRPGKGREAASEEHGKERGPRAGSISPAVDGRMWLREEGP